MPGNTKRRYKKRSGSKTGRVQPKQRRPRSREEAMQQRRKKPTYDRRDYPPTWRGSTIRGLFFAVLLFPIAILFGTEPAGAIVLTVIAALFYVPLAHVTDGFFYRRRKAKLAAEAQAKKQARGKSKSGS